MEDYKPNSHKYKAEQAAKNEKKVEKVVKGPVKTKKKSEISKLKNLVISEDASNVKSYILMDVLIPAFKKAVSDIITNGIDMILYGETGHSNRRTNTSTVSYRDYYDRRGDRRDDRRSRTVGYNYDDIVLETRGEAEEVLDSLCDLIETYQIASVADLYDLVGITCEYTDNKYGWTNLRNADVVRVRDGYMLRLPKALPIK